VRDLLLNSCVSDIDLATTAKPPEMVTMLSEANIRVVESGLKHGTITAVIEKIQFEITTLRIDTDTDGRHAVVQFTQDWKLDAARRDLTINAMSMDLEGQIYDYFNGEEHLRAGIILFVGAASTRITEDYLRILRYFRFHGRFSHTDTHDAACEQAVIEHCSGLQNISGERIRTEMLKIVKLPASVRLVAAMCRMNVLREIGMQTVSEDALAEFERVVGLSTNAATRVTALASTDEDMQRLVDRWRLTKEERDLGTFLVLHRGTNFTRNQYMDMIVRPTSFARAHIFELIRYQGDTALAAELEEWAKTAPKFPVRGDTLIKAGLKPGPGMGKTLKTLQDTWIESRYILSAEELIAGLL